MNRGRLSEQGAGHNTRTGDAMNAEMTTETALRAIETALEDRSESDSLKARLQFCIDFIHMMKEDLRRHSNAIRIKKAGHLLDIRQHATEGDLLLVTVGIDNEEIAIEHVVPVEFLTGILTCAVSGKSPFEILCESYSEDDAGALANRVRRIDDSDRARHDMPLE